MEVLEITNLCRSVANIRKSVLSLQVPGQSPAEIDIMMRISKNANEMEEAASELQVAINERNT